MAPRPIIQDSDDEDVSISPEKERLPVLQSPTMSKLKRRQTTMEQVNKKPMNTYGKKSTLDDLNLHRTSFEEGFNVGYSTLSALGTRAAVGPSTLDENITGHDAPRKNDMHEVIDLVSTCSNQNDVKVDSSIGGTIGLKMTPLEQEDQDELAQSPPIMAGGRILKERPKQRAKIECHASSQTDELGSEEEIVGLPKEHYQPRPSRFRESGAADELVSAIDFSKRPESTAKTNTKLKRRKTDGGAVVVHIDGPLSSSPDTFNSKIKAAEIQQEGERNDEPDLPSIKVSPQKRKRGRPKKSAAPSDSPQKKEVEPFQRDSTKPLQPTTTKPNLPSPTTSISVESSPANKPLSLPLAVAPSVSLEAQSRGMEKENEREKDIEQDGTKKGPPENDPDSKKKNNSGGRVAYRVGLSRKARIEPLLRVVRK